MNERFETQVINNEILEKLSLEHRYKFVNDNLRTVLNDKQFSFLIQVQDFCVKYEIKNKITNDYLQKKYIE